MAAEAFRIEIPIHVEDNTDPGVSKATEKMNKFDKQNEKTKKRLDQMNKMNHKLVSYKHVQRVEFRYEEFEKTTSRKIKRHLVK